MSVAYPQFPIGPNSSGGAEQILFRLERGIVEAGHRSIVIAAAGSVVRGELIETPAFGSEISEKDRENSQRIHRGRIEHALCRAPIDLIHFHGLDFSCYLPDCEIAKLVTLHLPVAWYSPSVFKLPNIRYCCVSEAQASTVPKEERPDVVLNGIDTGLFKSTCETRRNLLWLGRICAEKGTHVALRVAHRLQLPLVVAGPVHPFQAHQEYFANEVQPLLDSQRQWIGAASLSEKIELLSRARCLLIPSLVPETSSLVAMEAASSGTPVIAFRSGALPEVVEHGATGFIVDNEDEMASAVECVSVISAERCREQARARFDAVRMVRDYLALYERILTSA